HARNVFQCLLRSNGGKRQGKRGDALKPYINAARWIPLSIHPFASVMTVLYAGTTQHDEEDEESVYFC
ncbi:hypothetical protein BJV77DRAFT_1039376, partial [Russula vinacea]